MASNTTQTRTRRRLRRRKAGRARKNQLGRRSTPTYGELFAGLGEPGQPTPGTSAKPAAESSAE